MFFPIKKRENFAMDIEIRFSISFHVMSIVKQLEKFCSFLSTVKPVLTATSEQRPPVNNGQPGSSPT